MSENNFERLLQILLKKVLIVTEEVLKPHKDESLEIVKNIDKNDAVFIACALAYPESIIWSDDKMLKKQKRIKILETYEIIEYLNKN